MDWLWMAILLILGLLVFGLVAAFLIVLIGGVMMVTRGDLNDDE
jgi:hypothetical protein